MSLWMAGALCCVVGGILGWLLSDIFAAIKEALHRDR